MLRAAACRGEWRIHAAGATAISTRLFSSTPVKASEKRGAEEDDWREVGVFWDIENCPVPSSFDPFLVRPNIERALRICGFLGPISLSGYGDINSYRIHSLEALSQSGIAVRHVPSGGKNSSDRALMIDVLMWTMKHSPPAHVLLISGDSDFSVLLHKLRLLNYNILLAAPNNHGISAALVHAASRIWVWPDMATGEGLLGQVHTSGTPSPFHKDDMSRNREASINKPNTDLHQEMGHALENVEDHNGFKKAGWIPSLIVNRITSVVEHSPGISLGEMTKELKSMNVNPRVFGFADTYQFLTSIPSLETRFIDGSNMRDRTRFYLASTDNYARENALGDSVSKKLAPQDDVSCGIAESPNDTVGNEKPALRVSTNRDDKDSVKKGSSGQEKSPASSMRQSWGSRLLSLLKGG